MKDGVWAGFRHEEVEEEELCMLGRKELAGRWAKEEGWDRRSAGPRTSAQELIDERKREKRWALQQASVGGYAVGGCIQDFFLLAA